MSRLKLRNENQAIYYQVSTIFVGGSVKYQFGYLSTLHTGSVRALRRALELKRYCTHSHFAHALLTEITQFTAVQNRRCRVETFRFYLYGIVEINVEGVTRTVRKEFRIILR